MNTRLLVLTLIGIAAFAQGQNPSAPAAAEGPGVSQDGSQSGSQPNAPGPGMRGPEGRPFAGPGRPGGPGGPCAADGRGPMAGMRPGQGGPERVGGPGFGRGPEFAFEPAAERQEIADPEDEDSDAPSDREMQGPEEFGARMGFESGAPGPFGDGRAFGPRAGEMGFGPLGMPPAEALRAVLGLDDSQVESLRKLQREKARQLEENEFQFHRQQGVLMDLVEQGEPDGAALVIAVKSLHALRRRAGEIAKEFETKSAAVLNDEQRAKLESIEEAREIPRVMQEAARFSLAHPQGQFPER